ncbi:MAG: methyltransferase domain-containing protein [Oscillatoriophycideae cyanobacterium NC_groundwater_1537_Pr4_S-0.65um_50_18]|nr:methyltransferase domain-containing protein [Oscillatoriophycideae cyanobacterium NC_groundwater_1537_Pr4_S-0.65um_50_18]
MKFCKLADITDWQAPNFPTTQALLHEPYRNRKTWEYIQVYNGLQALGLLNGKTHALGLGVGAESLIYAFTNVCEQVVATDLYNSQNWETAAMPTAEVYQKNLFPYQPDRLSVQHMDMTQIEFPDESFDFIWSCCSIEHVNSFSELHKVYQEIHRVLKPNGIAALTTEYNPCDQHSYEPNMLFTDRYWIEQWFTAEQPLVTGFELLDPPSLTLADAPENQPRPKQNPETAIPIYSKDIVINSISFFLRKSAAFSQTYSDRWLPDPLRRYLTACELHRQADFAAAEALFQPLVEDEAIDARTRLSALRYLLVTLKAQNKLEPLRHYGQQFFYLCSTSENSDHLLPIAHQLKKAGLWQEAQSVYDRVTQLRGASANQVVRSFIGQAECCAQSNDYAAALALTEKAELALSPICQDEQPKVCFHRGFYQEKLANFEAAIAAYKQALAIATLSQSPKFQQNCQLRLDKCLKAIASRTPSSATATF